MKSFKQLTEAGTGQIYDTKPQSSDDATNPEVLLRGYGRLRHDQVKRKVVGYLEQMVKQAKRENWGSIEYEMKMHHFFMDAVQDVEKEMGKPAWKKKVTMLKRQGK